ncbi:SDR family NAD(P)-dependent oxidoreductase [Castellaniella sp.]|uniref:SDR family NAD(P)-dependent oxidoreductase n=1 Tax=Castellaniella sp. TaxID=1955812 RepID=UPI00355D528B
MTDTAAPTATRKADYDFSGLVAVVTGASKGIGAHIRDHLQRAGATVFNWDAAPAAGDEFALEVDVSDLAAVRVATQATIARSGQIDLLVNNAGFAGPTVPLIEYDPAVWARIVSVDLVGMFHVCHAVVPHMLHAGFGRIVNMASIAGKEGTPNSSAYSAAKAGILALTKALGKELAGTGVLVNAVAPAAIRTELLEQMSPEHVRTMVGKSPLGRLGEPEEVAELVAWLCSGSCSFSTGAVFDLSGGRATS